MFGLNESVISSFSYGKLSNSISRFHTTSKRMGYRIETESSIGPQAKIATDDDPYQKTFKVWRNGCGCAALDPSLSPSLSLSNFSNSVDAVDKGAALENSHRSLSYRD